MYCILVHRCIDHTTRDAVPAQTVDNDQGSMPSTAPIVQHEGRLIVEPPPLHARDDDAAAQVSEILPPTTPTPAPPSAEMPAVAWVTSEDGHWDCRMIGCGANMRPARTHCFLCGTARLAGRARAVTPPRRVTGEADRVRGTEAVGGLWVEENGQPLDVQAALVDRLAVKQQEGKITAEEARYVAGNTHAATTAVQNRAARDIAAEQARNHASANAAAHVAAARVAPAAAPGRGRIETTAAAVQAVAAQLRGQAVKAEDDRVAKLMARQMARRAGRVNKYSTGSKLRLATFNMSHVSKMQIQYLDMLGYDVVFLPEVHGSAVPLQDYGGRNRLLATTKSKKAWKCDSAGGVAFRLSPEAADSLDTWDVIAGSGGRAMWIQLRTSDGPLIVVGFYSPPNYRRTFPTQDHVLTAVTESAASGEGGRRRVRPAECVAGGQCGGECGQRTVRWRRRWRRRGGAADGSDGGGAVAARRRRWQRQGGGDGGEATAARRRRRRRQRPRPSFIGIGRLSVLLL